MVIAAAGIAVRSVASIVRPRPRGGLRDDCSRRRDAGDHGCDPHGGGPPAQRAQLVAERLASEQAGVPLDHRGRVADVRTAAQVGRELRDVRTGRPPCPRPDGGAGGDACDQLGRDGRELGDDRATALVDHVLHGGAQVVADAEQRREPLDDLRQLRRALCTVCDHGTVGSGMPGPAAA